MQKKSSFTYHFLDLKEAKTTKNFTCKRNHCIAYLLIGKQTYSVTIIIIITIIIHSFIQVKFNAK